MSAPVCEHFDPSLKWCSYYHGLLLREDVPFLLRSDGDFLVRVAQADKQFTRLEMVLSVFHDPHGHCQRKRGEAFRGNCIVHVVIQSSSKGKFFVDQKKSFNSVNEIVEHFSCNFLIVKRKKLLLRKGVTLAPWEFKTKDIRLGEYVGGQGVIDICKCSIRVDGKDRSAALICIKGQTKKSWEMLRIEAHQCRLLRTLGHPCVIKFYGICVLTPPCRFLLEFIPEGKLSEYLVERRGKLKRDELLRIMMCVGWGLDYLHSNGILFLDLAARSCLYDRRLVKLHDLRSARKALVSAIKTLKRMPVRRFAPESIERFSFSQKSDVYTYGVFIYEVFSQREPYEGRNTKQIISLVKRGKTNVFPANTPKTLVNFVKYQVWESNPSDRPNMESVMNFLTDYTRMQLEIKSADEYEIHHDANSPAMADAEFVRPPDEANVEVPMMDAVMIGDGKPRAAVSKKRKAKSLGIKSPKNVKREKKPARLSLPVTAFKMRPTAEAEIREVTLPTRKPGAAKSEVKGHEPEAETDDQALEHEKKAKAIGPRDSLQELFSKLCVEKTQESEKDEGLLAAVANKAGDFLFDVGAAILRAFQEESPLAWQPEEPVHTARSLRKSRILDTTSLPTENPLVMKKLQVVRKRYSPTQRRSSKEKELSKEKRSSNEKELSKERASRKEKTSKSPTKERNSLEEKGSLMNRRLVKGKSSLKYKGLTKVGSLLRQKLSSEEKGSSKERRQEDS